MEENWFNIFGIILAFVSSILYGIQRYKIRNRKDVPLDIIKSLVKQYHIDNEEQLDVETVESLISGIIERKRDEINQQEFDALQHMANRYYSEALNKDKLIRDILDEKTRWTSKMAEKDAQIAKLTRKINTLLEDIKKLQHTIATISGAEDSGPLEL